MNILIVASEVAPFAKVSTMADCTGALPGPLRRLGHDVRVITPRYKITDEQAFDLRPVIDRLDVPISNRREPCALLEGRIASAPDAALPVYFLKNDMYYQRDWLYGDSQGDYPDNAERFIYFSRSIPEICKALTFAPDVIHCHDWQTGLVPVYFRQLYKADPLFTHTAFVYTIHDLGRQGLFWHYDMHLTGLGWELFTPEGLEYYGKINLMKGGLIWSHVLNTLSPAYAQDVQTREYGHGLEGVLHYRSDVLYGVVNGIDTDVWNPQTDALIAATYGPGDLTGKAACKRALLDELLLPDRADLPLMAIMSRFDNQQGFDLLADIIERLLARDITLVIAGSGHEKYQKLLRHLADKHPERLSLRPPPDEPSAHALMAGADMLLMPSRQETRAVRHLQALRYGTVPIVRRTGVLKDTVKDYAAAADTGTGFTFAGYESDHLLQAIAAALDVYGNRARWQAIMTRGMRQDVSWETTAREYERLYRHARSLATHE